MLFADIGRVIKRYERKYIFEEVNKMLPNNKFHLPSLWHWVIIEIGTKFPVKGMPRKEANLEVAKLFWNSLMRQSKWRRQMLPKVLRRNYY